MLIRQVIIMLCSFYDTTRAHIYMHRGVPTMFSEKVNIVLKTVSDLPILIYANLLAPKD